MASLSKKNYESSLEITEFKGFYQGTDGVNTSLGYAANGKNFDVSGGVLHSMGAGEQVVAPLLAMPIATLMMLNLRFGASAGESRLIAATYANNAPGGDGKAKLWWRNADAVPSTAWTQIGTSLTINDARFDYVTYEVNSYWVLNGNRVDPKTPNAVEVVAANPIDVLLITNATDGMYIIYGDTMEVVPFVIQPSGADTSKRCGVMTRHAERIWVGAIAGDPDMLMYSTAYDPLNWDQNNDYPEDGAGDIQQPSWDGDSFVALRTYGSYLLAIKRNRIWRVSGTNPGDYYWKEQFGGGTIVENTVVVNNDYMFLLSYDGLMMYDGTSVQRYRQPTVQDIMNRVNWPCADVAVAAMRGANYCLALPLDGSTINNAILEYNTQERTFQLREGIYAASFLQHEDKLYYTVGSENGGYVGAVMLLNDSGTQLPMEYISAYQDLGRKSVVKSGFELYLTSDQPITITAAIRTEKKYKERTVSLTAGKTKRVRLNASGRMFRLELRVPETVDNWRLLGTVELVFEIDWD